MLKSILILEDELLIAKAYESYIKNRNLAAVFYASNLKSASEILNQTNPDIFILDVNLKNSESGLDFAKQIRKTNTKPIIFTTGNSNPETEQELLKIPNSTILLKPVNFEQLIKLIEER